MVNGTLAVLKLSASIPGTQRLPTCPVTRKSANVQRGIETRGHKCCLVKELSSMSMPLVGCRHYGISGGRVTSYE